MKSSLCCILGNPGQGWTERWIVLETQTPQLYRVGNSRNWLAQNLDWLSAVSKRHRTANRHGRTLMFHPGVCLIHSPPGPWHLCACQGKAGGGKGHFCWETRIELLALISVLCIFGVHVYLCSSSNRLLIQGRSWNVVGTTLSANPSLSSGSGGPLKGG